MGRGAGWALGGVAVANRDQPVAAVVAVVVDFDRLAAGQVLAQVRRRLAAAIKGQRLDLERQLLAVSRAQDEARDARKVRAAHVEDDPDRRVGRPWRRLEARQLGDDDRDEPEAGEEQDEGEPLQGPTTAG